MMSWPGLLFRPFFQISHQSCSGLVLGLEDFSLQFQSLGYLWESSSSKFPWLSLREKCTFNSFFGILLSSLSVFCQNQRRAPTVECEQHKRGRFVPLQGAPCCYTSITFKKKMLHMAQWTARFRWLLCFSIVSCSLFALNHYPLSFPVCRGKEMLLSVPGVCWGSWNMYMGAWWDTERYKHYKWAFEKWATAWSAPGALPSVVPAAMHSLFFLWSLQGCFRYWEHPVVL